jgi:hypothetical protein
MSEDDDAGAAANALPPGFYEKVSPYLHLCGMGCLQFFSRPDDPLPREITELTGLDMAGARMITAINSGDMLARQLVEEPELFYIHLLVGGLVLDGPLAAPVLRFLEQNMQLDAEQLNALREHLLPFGATFTELIGGFVAKHDEEAGEDLHLLRLQIEGAFARLADTLQAVDLPPQPTPAELLAAADDEPNEDDELDEDEEDLEDDYDEDDEPIFQIRFRQEQLHMLRLSVTLLRVLPSLSEQPFAQAAGQLSGCTEVAMDAVEERLNEADDETPTQLSWYDVAVLYQSTQVLAMALVSNVLDMLRWQERLTDQPAPDESPEELAENVARSQEMICLMISGFVECVQEQFDDEPRLERLRQEVTGLADLL